MTDVPSQSPAPASANGSTADAGSMPHLRHMSTTAGVGTQEYVAINLLAIVSVLLGVASVLVLLGDILLLVPLAGIVCAFVAWRQIRASNGTQTGGLLAMIGFLLSLLIGGGVLVQHGMAAVAVRSDETKIASLIDTLGHQFNARQYSQSYDLFSERFKSRVSQQEFTEALEEMGRRSTVGGVKDATWNKEAIFDRDAGGNKTAHVGSIVTFQQQGNSEPARWEVWLYNSGAEWKIDALPSLFPEKKKGRP